MLEAGRAANVEMEEKGWRNTIRMGVSWVAVGQQDNKEAEGKRASPNKAADSGFSDSGDSEASPCPGGVRGHQGGNHVSRVYLSGREEEHYQSPSSLPIPTVQATTQTTMDRRRRGGRRLRLNSTSSQDLTNNNSQSKSLWVGARHSGDNLNTQLASTGEAGDEFVSIDGLLREYRKDIDFLPPLRVSMSASISSSSAFAGSSSASPTTSEFSETLSHSGSQPSPSSEHRVLPRSPTSQWLGELPSLCEAECSVMLQSKSLGPTQARVQGFHPVYRGNGNGRQSILQEVRRIQNHARIVSRAFADLCRVLGECGSRSSVCSLVRVLESDCLALLHTQNSFKHLAQCSQLQELPGVRRPRGTTVTGEGDVGSDEVLVKEQQKMQKLLHDLKVSASRVRSSQLAPLVEIVTEFGTCLTTLVELMLSSKVEQVVLSVQQAASLTELETALGRVTRLGLEGNHLCRLVARHGGVRLLVEMLTSTKWLPARGSLLRTLGTVCCVLEAIRQLEEVRGVEVIARLVGDSGAREAERAEAAGVLAQVTSPWIEENDYILGVTENAFHLVASLTDLCRSTKCPETFLLAAAALANLSFLSPLVLTAMSQMDTLPVLLTFLKCNVRPSIYIQDQVATVLANMAARTDTRQKLLSQDLVQVLLYLLAASPETQGDLAAMAATQRVQQKAAIGISRLAGEALIVEGILSGSGLDRLVELSVCKKARLDSDSTLVAVITAVRRLAEQEDVVPLLEHLGAPELLNPCLVNSFQQLATKHESFV